MILESLTEVRGNCESFGKWIKVLVKFVETR